MELQQFKDFFQQMLEMHKRSIKPWKKRRTRENNDNDCYAQGWNACLREIEKTHKLYMQKLDEIFKECK